LTLVHGVVISKSGVSKEARYDICGRVQSDVFKLHRGNEDKHTRKKYENQSQEYQNYTFTYCTLNVSATSHWTSNSIPVNLDASIGVAVRKLLRWVVALSAANAGTILVAICMNPPLLSKRTVPRSTLASRP
jgi:hypothetical protein